MNFSGKTIALGVTGGIAAYKACEIVSLLKKAGADIHVVMTKNACEFVQPLTFETLSGNRVISEMFGQNFEFKVKHISLAKAAAAFLIAPASANFIGKYSSGIADDFLSTTVMAYTGPVLLAPAMNTNMLNSPATIKNIKVLKQRGVRFVDSVVGRLACGDAGVGRLAEPVDIVEQLYRILFPKNDFIDKTVLITAGATLEAVDPVRYITNRSSGKMGAAIADAASMRGARVIFICGKESVLPQESCSKTVKVETTDDMYRAVMENLTEADVVIKAAAPADYKVEPSEQKIKSKSFALNLVKNIDIAAEVGKIKGNRKLVVFAAETENLLKNAKEKLKKKNADLIVANDVTKEGAGFSYDTNIVTILSADKTTAYEKMTKREVAEIILDRITEL